MEAELDSDDPANVGLEAESEHVERSCIYSHGYSLRMRLLIAGAALDAALRRLGWTPNSTGWTRSTAKGAERWSLRGTTFLTQRRPRNDRLPLARRNKEWHTQLYSVQIERRNEEIFLDLHGVRQSDVERVLEVIMQLGRDDYVIKHYRSAERYLVLAPHEAYRLGEALGERPHRGRGRLAGKSFLARDLSVPIRIKTRTRRLAKLTVYRVFGGATAAFKVELRLAGKTRDRGTFQEADIAKLDDALMQLVEEHDLHPIPKPARWEPCGPVRWARDGQLERLGAAAYRGRLASQDLLAVAGECHTPEVAFLGESSKDPVSSLAQPYIRPNSHSKEFPSSSLPPSGPGLKPPQSDRSRNLWDALANDINTHECLLTEVILDVQQNPLPVIEALDRADPGFLALNILSRVSPEGHPVTWGAVTRLLPTYPGDQRTKTLVLVIDPDAMVCDGDAVAVWDEETSCMLPGPLHHENWHWDTFPFDVKANAGWLWPMLQELRDICEHTGLRVVLLTADARPDHGYGELQRRHYYRDTRVRSHIGDAGRYWAHTRYRVEPGRDEPRRVVLVKDEAQGLMGRVVA